MPKQPAPERSVAHIIGASHVPACTLNNQDPGMQLAELREYAGRRGWQIVEEFTDEGACAQPNDGRRLPQTVLCHSGLED